MQIQFKQISNILFALAFLSAILMLSGKTYGYKTIIHAFFFISGACALILSLLAARSDNYKGDFNVIFWIGSLLVFIGLLMKTFYVPYDTFVIIGGVAISGLSFFINPLQSKDDNDEELLDQ